MKPTDKSICVYPRLSVDIFFYSKMFVQIDFSQKRESSWKTYILNSLILKYISRFALALLNDKFLGNINKEHHKIFDKYIIGLFDNFSNVKTAKTTDLSPAESFAGIMLATIAADGYLANEEIQNLITTLYRMKLFQSYPSDHVSRMLGKLMKIMQTNNVDVLLNVSVQSLPEYLHETVFAVATDLILSDGEVSEEEEYILSKLCNYLSIDQGKVNKIIEVMIIKNKG